MRVSLVTLGDPAKQTGGYLYHSRLAEAAPRHASAMRFVSFPETPFPLPALRGRRVLSDASHADVVVIDSIVAAYASPWLASISRPVVGMLHQSPGGIDHRWLRARLQAVLDRRAYRHMRALFAASAPLADELRALHGDVRLVAPGRDVASSIDPRVTDLRRGRRVALLCVGNWVPRKGIVDLLDAFSTLPPDMATLHLVGDEDVDPRYGARVRQRLARLGDRVVVHGVVPKERVAVLYRDADVFVMPSYKEPYGTVYGEAMAWGLPVVGWRAGNLPYLAEHEREGLILEPHDIRGLAAALKQLAEDDALRVALSDAARARADDLPTWEETAATFFGELRAVVAAYRAHSPT